MDLSSSGSCTALSFDNVQLKEAGRSVQVLLSELKTCASCRNLQKGKDIHVEAMRWGLESNMYIANTLVNMYSKCGSMVDAFRVFETMQHPNVVSWTVIILGYAVNGESFTALKLFDRMQSEGPVPNATTFVAVLKACSLALKQEAGGLDECRKRGRQIHMLASKTHCDSDIKVQTTLVDMYAKLGSMEEARRVFDGIKCPNVVSWNVLILGYAANGDGKSALDLFTRMRSQGLKPDSSTVVASLKACAFLAQQASGKPEYRELGRELHKLASEIRCDSSYHVQSSLIDMYAKCGNMLDARKVFNSMDHRSVVSWTALILGYVENGDGLTALDLFSRMKTESCAPNAVTFVAALKACTSLALKQEGGGKVACKERGKRLHSLVLEMGYASDIKVQNTLIDMYAKCGSMADASSVFSSMKRPDLVSWNALIMGYAVSGEAVLALVLFTRMKAQGYLPESTTYSAVLKACGLLGALEFGKKVHAEMGSDELNVVLVNCLVDFYAKCGSLEEAHNVFDTCSRTRDLTTWTSLLAGYSRLGDTNSVLGLFQGLQDAGFKPDAVTFTCILACCSHAGLVAVGKQYFEAMSSHYGIVPTIEHYTCMVDILGRSNKLDEVVALLQSMPCSPNAVTWTAVLGVCRKWKNVEVGNLAFSSLLSLDDTNAAACVQMAHIYGSRGMHEEQKMVLGMRRKLKTWKRPGQSWWTNEVGEVHAFLAGDSA